MYDYAFDENLIRIAVVIGLFIAILFYERLKIAPGGMIVPGYIALFINHPDQIIYTFLLSFLVYLFVSKILMKRMILYGRRRFTITVFTGAIFVIITETIVQSYLSYEPFFGFQLIGLIIPGLIANEFVREQKTFYVTFAIFFISLFTILYILIFEQINRLTTSINLLASPNTFFITLQLLFLIAITIFFLFGFNWEKYHDKLFNLFSTIKKYIEINSTLIKEKNT